MSQPLPARLRTPGVLASELGVPIHRIQYLLATRSHIRPAAMAGRVRLYDRDALEALRRELAVIAHRAEGGSR